MIVTMHRTYHLLALCLLLAAAGCSSASGEPDTVTPKPAREAEAAPEPPASEPASAPAPEPVVEIVPMGAPSPALVDKLVESVRTRFRFQVRVRESVPMPREAWYKTRKRWRADKLLDALDALDTGDAIRAIGITEKEISTTKGKRYDWGIAGLGQMPGKSCVLTAYLFRRYRKKTPQRYFRYMDNLVLHELGHTLGLEHCPLERCIMADAKGSARRAARKSINEFCPRCTKLLSRFLRDTTVKGDWTDEELAIIGMPRRSP